MTRVMLYSPDVVGHPRVYCRVIADAIASPSCTVILAMGFSDRASLADSVDLHPLLTNPNVVFVDTKERSRTRDTHWSAEELDVAQRELRVDTTLFIEADKSNEEFLRIARGEAPRLSGRNIGIFANTAEWYPGEDCFSGERNRLLKTSLRTTVGNLKRMFFNRRNTPKYFFEHVIIGGRVLDEVLTKDERLSEWYGPPVYWMPEISRPFTVAKPTGGHEGCRLMQHELTAFLNKNKGREPVLYFGDATYYKGYDTFLEFVVSTSAVCAIHAGRQCDAIERKKLGLVAEQLRAQLHAEGRLFETNSYVGRQDLKELFFKSIRLYITTHRLALSSSTMIQAAEFGRPVLVPDRGLLGYRARHYGIGAVYRYGDVKDLRLKATGLWRGDLGQYQSRIQEFWSRFSDSAIQSFFQKKLLS